MRLFALKLRDTENRLQHTYFVHHNRSYLKADHKCLLSLLSPSVRRWFIKQVKSPVKWLIERWEFESNLSPMCLECTLVMCAVFRLGWTGINLPSPSSVSVLINNVVLFLTFFSLREARDFKPSCERVRCHLVSFTFAKVWCTISHSSPLYVSHPSCEIDALQCSC